MNGMAVTSDRDGNSNTLADASGRISTWDSQNRMASCTVNGVKSTYTYGADGLRRTSTANANTPNAPTTYYVYDGTMLIREMQQNAQGILQSTATYLQGPRGPEYRRDDVHSEGTYSDGTGTHPAGTVRWYVYDGLGSVVGEVDPSGNLTTTGKYDVYGAKRAGGTGTATSRQGFVGQLGHMTDDTGLVYMQARYYDPSTGRFVSEDPALNGNNWFVYCDNNPVNEIDTNGKAGELISALLTGVTSADYFRLGVLFSTLSLLTPALVKAGSIIGAVDGMACGLIAVGFFAAGLGGNGPEILAAMSVSTVGLVRTILSANAGERLLAGANAIALVATDALTAYSLLCVAALALDFIDEHPNP